MAQSAQRTDNNHLYNFASLAANRILGIIVDFTSNVLVLAAALLVVIDRNSESMTPGVAGLSIAYALSVRSLFNWRSRLSLCNTLTYEYTVQPVACWPL